MGMSDFYGPSDRGQSIATSKRPTILHRKLPVDNVQKYAAASLRSLASRRLAALETNGCALHAGVSFLGFNNHRLPVAARNQGQAGGKRRPIGHNVDVITVRCAGEFSGSVSGGFAPTATDSVGTPTSRWRKDRNYNYRWRSEYSVEDYVAASKRHKLPGTELGRARHLQGQLYRFPTIDPIDWRTGLGSVSARVQLPTKKQEQRTRLASRCPRIAIGGP